MLRKSFCKALLLAAAVSTTPRLARATNSSQRAVEILNRKNRVLEPPPRDLRSNKESWDYRVQTGTERLERLPADENGSSSVRNQDEDSNDDSEDDRGGHASSRFRRQAARHFDGERIFGIGFVGAGAYGVFGLEADFGVSRDLSFGFGLGTGMSYSTWGLHTRYFLKQSRISTFLQAGYANWFLGKSPSGTEPPVPQYLAERFFTHASGTYTSPQRVHIFYPGVGVLYQHSSGLAASAQLQYLVNAADFSGGLFGAVGFYYYF